MFAVSNNRKSDREGGLFCSTKLSQTTIKLLQGQTIHQSNELTFTLKGYYIFKLIYIFKQLYHVISDKFLRGGLEVLEVCCCCGGLFYFAACFSIFSDTA